MLTRKRDSRHLIKKIGKLFLCMVIWAGIYYIFNLISGIHVYSGASDLVAYLLTEPIHLWYIYAIITLYLFTPMLYIYCSNASKREYLYALILTFIFGSVVVVALRCAYFQVLSVIVDKMKVPYMLGFMFLYLLGGYSRKYEVVKSNVVYILGILGAASTIIGTLILSQSNTNKDLLLSFFAPNVLMAGVGFYIFIKQFCLKHPIKNIWASTILHTVANCTLGIYLLHPLLITVMQKYSPLYYGGLAAYFAIPFRTMLTFIASVLIVFILKKIPGLKWIL